ncbi:class I adenylate-forming enzyme family protein [Rhizobium sp. Root482]|uniref:class I adenylate-forming enzyme family protein n=1 Tax=Rhizobium sp. Root482 TaxID=1736543 RepID=UPI0006F6FBB6|nr:class I adenylate-forming enzyme family protein [Rhizobium sp. Root482]KQY13911.1 AMP-dependent synthetase [Rhizobium sp. Root482]
MRIEDYLRRSTERVAGKTALVVGGRRLSYAELSSLSDGLAVSLLAGGVTKGDRVLVFMENRWEAAVSIFAVWKAGAVLCPINPSTKAGRLAFIIGNCKPAAIIAQGKLAGIVVEATAAVPVAEIILTSPSAALEKARDFAACLVVAPLPALAGLSDDDLAMIIYTSGSTGEPKGVMMGHAAMDAAAGSIISYLEKTADDIILNVLPMAFGYGLYQLLMSVRLGATLILEKSFAFPYAIFERIREERVTGFPLVPTMAAMIAQMEGLDPGLFASLRYMTSAAAPLPIAHIERLRAFFPHVRLFSMYGQTECTRAAWLPPAELDRRPGSVGLAIPGTQATVVDEAGHEVAAGTVGELVVSGPHLMRGYWENPQATQRALRPDPAGGDLRLHTGDLFTIDAQGFLTFVARKDDIIKSRGEKVAPKEVEAVLHALGGVSQALVIGVADPVLGQAIRALVVASDPQLCERDVIRHCARHLEDYMVPKSVEFRTFLPVTDTGKVSRRLAAAIPDQTGRS